MILRYFIQSLAYIKKLNLWKRLHNACAPHATQ